MSNTWDHRAPPMTISVLNHDVLLDIFHWYRLGNTRGNMTNGLDRSWNLERWWFKLIHVCQTWRHVILASPTSLDLHLVCTYGTPVTTMLTHSPPLPLIIYYPRGLGDVAGKEEEDVHFLLQQRERVRRILIGASAESLLRLLGSMDGEYPALQHLVISSHTKILGASSRTSVELPAKLQAPLMCDFTLFDVRPPVGSELLLRAEGLVTLELVDIADSLEAHPAHLVAQLAHMAQLERLVVHFRTALPNRTIIQTLSGVGTTLTALPRLNLLSFRGGSAYLEGIFARLSAPSLRTLSLNFFAQLTFDLPRLLHFIRVAQEQPSAAYAEEDGARFQFDAAVLDFDAEAAFLLLYFRGADWDRAGTRTNTLKLHVSCCMLDWQLAALAQICSTLAPLFERVERLTLGLHISHSNSDANLSLDVEMDSERAQWHALLRAVLRLADVALSAAGRAKKGTSSEATEAFLRVQEEIKRFGPPPQKGTPGSHRKKLLDPSTELESASKKDEKSTSIISKVKSAFKAPLPSGHTKNVYFVILEPLHYQLPVIINQEIDNSTTTAEVLWRFGRYPEKSCGRITPGQNPHFYLRLSKDAASYDDKFHEDPLKDFFYGLHSDKIYVLLDKSCRLFLDVAKPHIPRIFGNLWKPHRTVILKDVSGNLESEDIVLRNIGENQDYWYRPSITVSSQRHIQSGYSGADSDIVYTPFESARAVIHAAVRAQGVDLMIRDRSRPLPPADSGWKLLPSPEPSAINTQTQAPLPARPQSVDNGIDWQVEPPIGTLSNPPPLAPASSTIPSPLPGQDRELLSEPPVQMGSRGRSCFREYVFDYDP
ncbi:hypothetical protein EDB84DRAFT_1628145 [Lactarius hengduanensis]|nr:hypothetical protein EDB84DRAFT_1628145 [Lactarius hengduanensis]